jgi:hypothetical protein
LKRAFYTPATIAVVAALALLLGSCSAGQTEDRGGEEGASEASSQDVRGSSEASRSDLQASLAPIVHLTSAREDVSTQELSQNGELAVPQESQELARELLGRSDFEGFDSSREVVDFGSRTPEAVGLVPWDEIDPRVKALPVDGEPLLDPGT